MISALGELLRDRGTVGRRVGGVLLHSSGSGVVEKARQHGCTTDEMVDAFVATAYLNGAVFPHYLVGRTGHIYALCDEDKVAAHAKWEPWEREAYAIGNWRAKWARDYHDDVVPVPLGFYADWDDRWTTGSSVRSPLHILQAAGGRIGPNATYVGVEFVAGEPFTDAQYRAGVALVRDVADRHQVATSQLRPGAACGLPCPTLLGHSDIGPCRRWARSGGWDPPPASLDWDRFAALLNAPKGTP